MPLWRLNPENPYENFNSTLSSFRQVLSKQTGVIRNRELFCQVGEKWAAIISAADRWGMQFSLHESETLAVALKTFAIVMKNTWGLVVKMDVLKDLETKTEQELHNITILTYQVR